MRWAALLTFAAGVVAALSVAQLAPGQASERVRVDRPAAGLPSNLYVVVNSPDEYSRQALRSTSGSWVGPAYWLPSNPAMRANATIDWEVGLDERPLNTERIALANLTKDWVEDQRAGVSLEHVVGRRVVGTIPGFFVLQVERRSSPSELVLAFPVGGEAPRLRPLPPPPSRDRRLLGQGLGARVELEPRPGAAGDVPRAARGEPAAVARHHPRAAEPRGRRRGGGLLPPRRGPCPDRARTEDRQPVAADQDDSCDRGGRLRLQGREAGQLPGHGDARRPVLGDEPRPESQEGEG